MNEDDPWQRQEGGDHYTGNKIQPLKFAMVNGLNFCQANVIKYICRYKDKGGKEDLLKAKHYIELLIDYEYPEDPKDRNDGEGSELLLGHKDKPSVRVPTAAEARPAPGFFWGFHEDIEEGL